MRLPRVRLTVRRMMIVVAVAAVALVVWEAWFDPIRRWQREVQDDQDSARRWEALDEVFSGRTSVDQATAVATLTRALGSPSRRVRETAAFGLSRLGPAARPAAGALVAALADPEPLIRSRAAAALAAVAARDAEATRLAVPPLTSSLSDPARSVRMSAAMTLAQLGHGADGVPVLIEALRRDDDQSHTDALWALGLIGPVAARDALPEIRALEARIRAAPRSDRKRYLPIYAAEARCQLGDRDAGLTTLRDLLADPDEEVAREAQNVLARLTGDSRNDPGFTTTGEQPDP